MGPLESNSPWRGFTNQNLSINSAFSLPLPPPLPVFSLLMLTMIIIFSSFFDFSFVCVCVCVCVEGSEPHFCRIDSPISLTAIEAGIDTAMTGSVDPPSRSFSPCFCLSLYPPFFLFIYYYCYLALEISFSLSLSLSFSLSLLLFYFIFLSFYIFDFFLSNHRSGPSIRLMAFKSTKEKEEEEDERERERERKTQRRLLQPFPMITIEAGGGGRRRSSSSSSSSSRKRREKKIFPSFPFLETSPFPPLFHLVIHYPCDPLQEDWKSTGSKRNETRASGRNHHKQ